MRATCDVCPEPDIWLCGLCGARGEYEFGAWVAMPDGGKCHYACPACQQGIQADGGCVLTEMQAIDLGLCVLCDSKTTVWCCVCGQPEVIDCPMWFGEGVCDGLSALGWTFRADGPRCLDCKDAPEPKTYPQNYPDIFAE